MQGVWRRSWLMNRFAQAIEATKVDVVPKIVLDSATAKAGPSGAPEAEK